MLKPIGISAEFVQPGKVGGTEFFLKNLVRGMMEHLDGREKIRLFGPLETFQSVPGRLEIIPPLAQGGSRFIREFRSYIRHGRSLKGMIFPNYFTPPWKKTGKVVTVIHDAQYRHHPKNFSLQKKIWLNASHRMTLARADKVVATSEFVKRDLLEIYGTRWDGKIVVIPIPVSWDRFEVGPESAGPEFPARFVLSVAAQYPHKNLATLIRAFKRVKESDPGISLVLAGQLPQNLIGAKRGEDLRALIRELGLADSVMVTGHVPDRVLLRLYGKAELFVFPSLFEGFGIPPVEALGFGLPVITTDRASLPEVTLGMARLVKNPLDPEELAEAIKEIIRDPASHRKTPDQIRKIRETYLPSAIGRRYCELLDD